MKAESRDKKRPRGMEQNRGRKRATRNKVDKLDGVSKPEYRFHSILARVYGILVYIDTVIRHALESTVETTRDSRKELC